MQLFIFRCQSLSMLSSCWSLKNVTLKGHHVLHLHEWCLIQSNGHDEVPPIPLMGVATSSLGYKIRIKVRAMVDQIQVK